jgi:Lysophospholipase
MAIKVEYKDFLSSQKATNIVYTRWIDDKQKPRAILLIAHGMAEYIGRYDDFARYMVTKGYAVYGNDHLGHGKTAGQPESAGYFAPKDGRYHVVDDMRSLCQTARADFAGLPVVLLGHSMGSFVTRVFCARYSKDIDAAIIMGTSGRNPAAGAGIALVNIISLFKGEKHRSAFVDKIAFTR